MYALVTGASSGIGRALAVELCRSGSRVLGVARSADALEEVRRICGSSFGYLALDLGDPGSVDRVVEEVSRGYSPLDLLVNNAGFGLYRRLVDTSPEDVVGMVSVNLVAPLLLTLKLLPYMRRGSAVVNVVTAGAFVLMSRAPLYGATKIGLHYATEALRRELAERGIKVVGVYPGVVRTAFHRRAGGPEPRGGVAPEEVARRILEAVRSGRARVFVPGYLSIAKLLFGPHLPLLY